MKKSKVTKILGMRWNMRPGSEGEITIRIHTSPTPGAPWAAAADGEAVFGRTPHEAINLLLESIAKSDRAERDS